MPKTVSFRICKHCEKPAKLNIINGRNKGFLKTCGSEDCLKKQYKLKEVCEKKRHFGENHPKWIKDRSKLKNKRLIYEEKEFFKFLMEERRYTCQLTGLNGKLSVHHIKGVWSNPELRFDSNNCIVVLNSIHKKFHKIYGNRSNQEDWKEFLKNKEYESCFNVVKKRNYTPFIDRTNLKYGRLLVLRKEGKKWVCKCDCGNEAFVDGSNFRKTKSCGCYKKEVNRRNCLSKRIWEYSPISNKNIKNAM